MESLATREYGIREAVWHQPIGLYEIHLAEMVWNPCSARYGIKAQALYGIRSSSGIPEAAL